jgi:hypothetical protein
MKSKTERNVTQAVAWMPDVVLGNRSGKRAMGIELRRGEEPLGRFLLAKGGIEFQKPGQKKQGKQISWKKLAKLLTQ